MMFYKVEGVLATVSENENSRRAHRENVRKVAVKSDEFNNKNCRNSFYFMSGSSDGIVTIGVITDRYDDIDHTLQAYLKYIECDLKNIVISEITINSVQKLLGNADGMDYIPDDDAVMEKYGLDRITGRRGRGLDFGESIIDEQNRKEIFKRAERYLLHKTFLPELERIYTVTKTTRTHGHPVHYMLQTDDIETLGEYDLTFDTYFSEANAIAEFIVKAIDECDTIICQCEYGQSHSATCAAAIKEYIDYTGIVVFSNY